MKKLAVTVLLGLLLGMTALPGVYAAWNQDVTVTGTITTVPHP